MEGALVGGAQAYAAVCLALSALRRRPVLQNRSAAALAAFVAVYRALRRSATGLSPAAAGAGAGGAAMALLEPSSRTTVLAHSAIHAARALWRRAVARGAAPDLPHLDVLALMLAGYRMPTAWLYEVGTFDRGHVRSLDHYSAVPAPVLAELRAGLPAGRLAGVCGPVHGDLSCARHAATRMWPTLLARALRVYVPVHLVTGVLLRLPQWRRAAKSRREFAAAARQWAERVLRSCLFLALFYQVPMLAACAASGSGHLRAGVGVGGMLGATAVLLEPPSRRGAIVPVGCAFALVSLVRGLGVRAWAPGQVAGMAAASAALVSCAGLPGRAESFLEAGGAS